LSCVCLAFGWAGTEPWKDCGLRSCVRLRCFACVRDAATETQARKSPLNSEESSRICSGSRFGASGFGKIWNFRVWNFRVWKDLEL
jgi:hypothetical protein